MSGHILDIAVVDGQGGARVMLKPGSSFSYYVGYEATAPEIDRLIQDLGKARDEARRRNRPNTRHTWGAP